MNESDHPTPHRSDSTRLNAAGKPPGESSEAPDTARILASGLAGRYRLVRTLGKGGFANVYLAHDSVLDQDVAVKILKLGLASKADQDRFLFEARVGAKLRHPNIANVFDIVQTSEGLQMIMEYYPAGTLGEKLKAGGALKPRQASDVARQVAQALSHAHRHSIVHRDVKPANIFFSHDGMVKLGDFGIAANSELHEFTQTGMIIGTPLYMSPEQSTDSRDVDPRADLYALGLTLYHMLTGRPPRVLELDKLPEAFRRLISVATDHDRSKRVVSAQQFIAMLDQIDALPRPVPSASFPREDPAYPETRIETRETEEAGNEPSSNTNAASTTRTDASQAPAQPEPSITTTGVDTAALVSTITAAQHTSSSRIWMSIAVAALIVMAGMGVAMFYSVWSLKQNGILAVPLPAEDATSSSLTVAQAPAISQAPLEPAAKPGPAETLNPESAPTPSPQLPIAQTPVPSPTLTPIPTPAQPPAVAVKPVASQEPSRRAPTPVNSPNHPEPPKSFAEVLLNPRPQLPQPIASAIDLMFEKEAGRRTSQLKEVKTTADKVLIYNKAIEQLEPMIDAKRTPPGMPLEIFLLSLAYLQAERDTDAATAFLAGWRINQLPKLRHIPISRQELETDFNLAPERVAVLFSRFPPELQQ